MNEQKVSNNVSNKVKNKRQIYLWDDNKDYYDSLPNKSRLINLLIRKYREENGIK